MTNVAMWHETDFQSFYNKFHAHADNNATLMINHFWKLAKYLSGEVYEPSITKGTVLTVSFHLPLQFIRVALGFNKDVFFF